MQVVLRCPSPHNCWFGRYFCVHFLGVPLCFRAYYRETDLQYMDRHLYLHTDVASWLSDVGCFILPW